MKRAWLLLALAGCYSPAERDCTVSCSAAKDCIGGQVCGADHYCAAPDVAGHCSVADAAPATTDAPAAHDVTLTVQVMGNGSVTVGSIGSCPMETCMFQVPQGQPLQLTAMETKPNKMFQMWMMACSGSQPTCALTPNADVKVVAKFE
ncbi:MAG: hypothetical protein JO257_18675 [Deltaproteobacteria bacterium]|nr:hypothetical protein [Deltaproteobacteria bacterium]